MAFNQAQAVIKQTLEHCTDPYTNSLKKPPYIFVNTYTCMLMFCVYRHTNTHTAYMHVQVCSYFSLGLYNGEGSICWQLLDNDNDYNDWQNITKITES